MLNPDLYKTANRFFLSLTLGRAINKVLVTAKALNMEINIPMPNTRAKPFTKEVPKKNKIIAPNKLVILLSRIACQALVNPVSAALVESRPVSYTHLTLPTILLV